ncbi:MAG: hypothetical protein HRT66_01605 [Flavobacteriaceae bacterium]|nr:hypothetical protein [Flavobacteriaceae bacterium]
MKDNYNVIGYAILLFVIIGCSNDHVNFKRGTFKIILKDSLTTFIERNENYQMESSLNTGKSELFKIHWISNERYVIDVIDIKSPLDTISMIVDIDSISGNTYYQTSYLKGIDYKYSSKVVKISNNTSILFKNIIKGKQN